jgi:prepilin signal peptidase PulO-like enzyme (type II secretory pathway)
MLAGLYQALLFGVAVSIIDIRTQRIPNWLLLIGLVCSLAAKALWLRQGLIALSLATVFYLCVFLLFAFFAHGKLGMGDVKYIALISFSFGLIGTWFVLVGACISGLGYALIFLKPKKEAAVKAFPFAPFLGFGMLIALIAKYLKLW